MILLLLHSNTDNKLYTLLDKSVVFHFYSYSYKNSNINNNEKLKLNIPPIYIYLNIYKSLRTGFNKTNNIFWIYNRVRNSFFRGTQAFQFNLQLIFKFIFQILSLLILISITTIRSSSNLLAKIIVITIVVVVTIIIIIINFLRSNIFWVSWRDLSLKIKIIIILKVII